MKNIIENNEDQFANGQVSRDLRVNSDATQPETQLNAVNVVERCSEVTPEEFPGRFGRPTENREREWQRRGSQLLPEQIDADERLPGHLRAPHLPGSNHGEHAISQIRSASQTNPRVCHRLVRNFVVPA